MILLIVLIIGVIIYWIVYLQGDKVSEGGDDGNSTTSSTELPTPPFYVTWAHRLNNFLNSIPTAVDIAAIIILSLLGLYILIGLIFRCSPWLQATLFGESIFSFEECPVVATKYLRGLLPGLVSFELRYRLTGGDGNNNNNNEPESDDVEKNPKPKNPSPEISLGGWYIPPWVPPKGQPDPKDLSKPSKPTIGNNMLSDERLVVLVAHGSADTRAEPSRVHLYGVLSQKLSYHVVAFEYRGNGDSSGRDQNGVDTRPTGPNLAEDARLFYRWLLETKRVPAKRILLWGHSIGTGVLVEAITTGSPILPIPLGVILESAFSSMKDVVAEGSYGPLIDCARKWVPLMERTVLSSLAANPDYAFDSLGKVPLLKCPLLLLHAKNDEEISISLGRKLYDEIKENGSEVVKGKSRFQEFPSGGHMEIARENEAALVELVRRFVASLE